MTLDGIEMLLSKRFPKMKVYFIRYADDLIVTAPTKVIAEEAREIIREFLAVRGLELSPEKTVITHIDEGFDFLGWNLRKYKGFLMTKPSRKSIEAVTQKIRTIFRKARTWTQEQLIDALNPIIRGWTNYHRHSVAKKVFGKLDAYVWTITWQWAKRRHPNKGHTWIAHRYWHSDGNRNWVFRTAENTLVLFSDTKIRRHAMPKLDANPYLDRDYFLERKERTKKRSPWIQTSLSAFTFNRPLVGL